MAMKVEIRSALLLLLTARDVGAAGHMAALATSASTHGAQCVVVAQGAAVEYLAARNVAYLAAEEWLGCAEVSPTNFIGHATKAGQRLKEHSVAAVVCGLSPASETGIDEIVIAGARIHGIPSVAVQDFWGDVRPDKALQPDHYLVLDEQAARLTRPRTDAKVHVTGSLKHTRFTGIDFLRLRREGRAALGVGLTAPLIGFFGQNLLAVEGYLEVLSDIGRASASIGGGTKLFYKPHPRESDACLASTLRHLKAAGAVPLLMESTMIESAIAAADVVLSCFSTVGLDAAYMMCAEDAPAVSIICADYPADVRDFWRPSTGLGAFPLVTAGLALAAHDGRSLREAMRLGLDIQERRRQALASHSAFGKPGTPIQNALKAIEGLLGRKAAMPRQQ